MTTDVDFADQRNRMVDRQLAARDIGSAAVLQAMRTVPREEFVPDELQHTAYSDRPLPIGHGQTISQPYIVALMTQLAAVTPESRTLDVGTGCGYQAAVLAEIADRVVSIEVVPELAAAAEARLRRLGYSNVDVVCGDGRAGWPSEAPWDAIIVAAAPREVPQALLDQLADGGRLVIPVGSGPQRLMLYTRHGDRIEETFVCAVSFVPLTDAPHEGGGGDSRMGF